MPKSIKGNSSRKPPEPGSHAEIEEWMGQQMPDLQPIVEGLDGLIRNRVELPVYVAEDPLTAVVRGTGKVLEHLDHYERVLQ